MAIFDELLERANFYALRHEMMLVDALGHGTDGGVAHHQKISGQGTHRRT
jgi:hypothetical protein